MEHISESHGADRNEFIGIDWTTQHLICRWARVCVASGGGGDGGPRSNYEREKDRVECDLLGLPAFKQRYLDDLEAKHRPRGLERISQSRARARVGRVYFDVVEQLVSPNRRASHDSSRQERRYSRQRVVE